MEELKVLLSDLIDDTEYSGIIENNSKDYVKCDKQLCKKPRDVLISL